MSNAKPVYCLAGGSFSNPKSMLPSLSLALKECGAEKPRIAYLGVASGDNLLFFKAVKSLLKEAGAGDVFMPRLAKLKADVPAAIQALESADAIFITGGEVEDGMRWLKQHGLVGFLKELYIKGKLFFGVSAGSIMMGTHWVRWSDPKDDATAELFDCLGFAPTVFDTHAEDEDWKELIAALKLLGPGASGYGIPRGGAVSVDSNGKITPLEKTLLCFENIAGYVQQV